ncbi:MAG: hypothetical protein K0Q96_641 [Rubrobacteraceae bacterium]|nr:hypothetical protein [Rubrobacteraceae bacterium]
MIFTRFTDRSRMCIEAALDEAKMLGHDSLGDEDLLLGILRADEGIGRPRFDRDLPRRGAQGGG